MKSALLILFLIILTGCASQPNEGGANKTYTWDKPGMNQTQLQQDLAECRLRAHSLMYSFPYPQGGIIGAIKTKNRETQIISDCMITKGYTLTAK